MNQVVKQKPLAKLEKGRLIKELNDLNKGLISYKTRQEKFGKMKFSEGQKKSLDALRLRLKRKYQWSKETISKYGGSTSMKILGMNWDAFVYSLSSLYMIPEQFTALDRAINVVTTAIGKIESIPIASTDWRDLKVTQYPRARVEKVSPSLDTIQLHPRIIEVSQSLFESGHYSQAIFEAFKAVNNFVKEKTGLSLDGKDLMAKVFREEAPIIKLNKLKTKSERDEQEGFKFLFIGAMVGIRNPKAHDNIVQTDPNRALEYLGFASLLMKRAEEGKLVADRENDQTI